MHICVLQAQINGEEMIAGFSTPVALLHNKELACELNIIWIIYNGEDKRGATAILTAALYLK